MGIEGKPTETPEFNQEPQVNEEEHSRRAGSLGERIQGGDDEKEVVPKKPPEANEESEAENMARQVPPEITEGMLGG